MTSSQFLTALLSLTLLALTACPLSVMAQPADNTLTPLAPANQGGAAAQTSGPTRSLQDVLSAYVSLVNRSYRLGPNDVLSIEFLGAPEWNREVVRVSPDGVISHPGFGRLEVTGQTINQVTQAIEQRSAKFLKYPQASVTIAFTKPLVVHIAGAVLRPGSYELNTNPARNVNQPTLFASTKIDRSSPILSNVLLAAGGISYDANLESVHVINDLTGEHYQLNMFELLEGNIQQDMYLTFGDRIVVDRLPTPAAVDPKRYKTIARATFSPENIPVRVYGYVRTPGLIQVDPRQNNNLNSAIMQAGAYEFDFGYAPKKVIVARADGNGGFTSFEVDPKKEDIPLMPNDMIYVPEKFLPKVRRTARVLSEILDPAFRGAATYNNWALVFDPTRNFLR
jgi:protein involved in polysaccharide export with SLBB domain